MAPKKGGNKSQLSKVVLKQNLKNAAKEKAVKERKSKTDAQTSRFCNKRDAQIQAERLAVKHMKDKLDEHDLYSKVIGGKTAFEKVVDLVQLLYPQDKYVTVSMLLEIVGEYRTMARKAENYLEPEDATAPRVELVRLSGAALALNNREQNRKGFISYVKLAGELNENEVCGVLNLLFMLNEHEGQSNAQFGMEVIRLGRDKELPRKWPRHWEKMRARMFEISVSAAANALTSPAETPTSWWVDNRTVVKSFNPNSIADIDTLILNAANLEQHMTLLKNTCASSPIAQLFFKAELQKVSLHEWKVWAKAKHQVMLAAAKADIGSLESGKAELRTKAADYTIQSQGEHQLNCILDIAFFDKLVQVKVKGFYHHANLIVTSIETELTLGKNKGIRYMSNAEKELHEDPTAEIVAVASPIQEDALETRNAGRSAIKRLTDDKGKTGYLTVMSALDNGESYLKNKDPMYEFDTAVMVLMGTSWDLEVVQDRWLKLLPTALAQITLDETIQQIENLHKGHLFQFLDAGAQGKMNGVLKLFQSANAGDMTKAQFDSYTGFSATAAGKLKFFLRYDKPVQGTLDKETLFGDAAVKEMIKVCTGKKEKTPVSVLNDLVHWGFLLDGAQAKIRDDLSKRLAVAPERKRKVPAKQKQGEQEKKPKSDPNEMLGKTLFKF